MRSFLTLLFIHLTFVCCAQEIVNFVLVSDKGITENIKEAKYFIVIKNYGDSLFERAEYKLNRPLMRVISYKDSSLTVKNGHYIEYAEDGWIASEGEYVNDKKNGLWIIYSDNAKAKTEYKYIDDQLVGRTNVDSVEKANKNKPKDPQEIEARFKGGDNAFSAEVAKRMREAIDSEKLKKSGNVSIRFIVSTSGKMDGFYLTRSTEFGIDEVCLSIMRSIPQNWIPASQHGKLVKAFREQPLTFSIQDQ